MRVRRFIVVTVAAGILVAAVHLALTTVVHPDAARAVLLLIGTVGGMSLLASPNAGWLLNGLLTGYGAVRHPDSGFTLAAGLLFVALFVVILARGAGYGPREKDDAGWKGLTSGMSGGGGGGF